MNERLERALCADPHVGAVADPFSLELEGTAIPDIVADVFLVDEDLVDGPACPRSSEIGTIAAIIENGRDLTLGFSVRHEQPIHPADSVYLICRARHQDHSVSLNAFLLPSRELAFGGADLVNQAAAQPVSLRSALTKTKFDQAALASKDLYR